MSNSYNDLVSKHASYFFSPKFRSEHLLSIHRLVKMLGLPASTLRRWERNGSFPPACRRKENATRYWQADSIRTWLQSLTPPEAKPHEELHAK